MGKTPGHDPLREPGMCTADDPRRALRVLVSPPITDGTDHVPTVRALPLLQAFRLRVLELGTSMRSLRGGCDDAKKKSPSGCFHASPDPTTASIAASTGTKKRCRRNKVRTCKEAALRPGPSLHDAGVTCIQIWRARGSETRLANAVMVWSPRRVRVRCNCEQGEQGEHQKLLLR